MWLGQAPVDPAVLLLPPSGHLQQDLTSDIGELGRQSLI